jgi:hypothetical protein
VSNTAAGRTTRDARAGDALAQALAALQDAAYLRAVEGPGLHVLAPLLRQGVLRRRHVLAPAADALARDSARAALTHGWTPAALHRFAQRRLDPAAMTYLTDALAAAGQVSLAPPWHAELAEVGASVWWSVTAPHLTQWSARHGHKRFETMRIVIDVLALLCHVPRTDAPLPGSPQRLHLEAGALVRDRRIAAKIDALHARSAASSYPEEAQACAAKAQQLLIRHATR